MLAEHAGAGILQQMGPVCVQVPIYRPPGARWDLRQRGVGPTARKVEGPTFLRRRARKGSRPLRRSRGTTRALLVVMKTRSGGVCGPGWGAADGEALTIFGRVLMRHINFLFSCITSLPRLGGRTQTPGARPLLNSHTHVPPWPPLHRSMNMACIPPRRGPFWRPLILLASRKYRYTTDFVRGLASPRSGDPSYAVYVPLPGSACALRCCNPW